MLNEPKQQRTRDRLERIFEAAEDLFAERGFDSTSMRDVAKAVPCSMSAIYDRFGSKEALLLAMHERYHARTLAAIEEKSPAEGAAVDLRDLLPKLIRFAMKVSRENRGLRRAMLAQSSFDRELASKERKLRALLSTRAFRMILQGAEQMDHPAPRVAADYVARLISALMLQRYDVSVEHQNLKLDDEGFAEETTRACLRYLGLEAAEVRRPEVRRRKKP